MTRAVTDHDGAVSAPADGATPHETSVGDALDALAATLGGAMAPPARAEARDLIAAVLDVPRFWPSAHRNERLGASDLARIEDATERLRRGMPFAYAVRRAPFRSLSLYVDERVLIPRPETELIVDLVLAATGGGRGTAVDVGTGSGAIALALATEGRFDRVIATDISVDALTVARINATEIAGRDAGVVAPPSSPIPHPASLEFIAGSFLSPLHGVQADVIVANPPYISWTEAGELPAAVRDWEPPVALFAGDDGMAAIEAIVRGAERVLVSGGVLALEVDFRRADAAAKRVGAVGGFRDVIVRPDLTGRARFVAARRA